MVSAQFFMKYSMINIETALWKHKKIFKMDNMLVTDNTVYSSGHTAFL